MNGKDFSAFPIEELLKKVLSLSDKEKLLVYGFMLGIKASN